MADELKQMGEDFSFRIVAGTIVIVGPDASLTQIPTVYTRDDLSQAVRQGLLQKTIRTVADAATAKSSSFECYVAC